MASERSEYEMLDFGDGRRLERFGNLILDRPAPAAEGIVPSQSGLWDQSHLTFQITRAHRGCWWADLQRWKAAGLPHHHLDPAEQRNFGGRSWCRLNDQQPLLWNCRLPIATFQLKCTDFGHVGLFPEHAIMWESLVPLVKSAPQSPRVMSLFAYTGGSSISMARAGAQVTHVEAARNVVQWARANAKRSSPTPLSIRWLVEDVMTYVRREQKRESQYEGFILDPPTYGHGPKGQTWKIQRDLPLLLQNLAKLASESLTFVLLTVHSSDFDPGRLRELFQQHFLEPSSMEHIGTLNCQPTGLKRADGLGLDVGVRLLWQSDSSPNQRKSAPE